METANRPVEQEDVDLLRGWKGYVENRFANNGKYLMADAVQLTDPLILERKVERALEVHEEQEGILLLSLKRLHFIGTILRPSERCFHCMFNQRLRGL
jgi:hypothetical protein